MSFFLTYDISFISAFLLFILYITIKTKEDTTSTTGRLFQKLIGVNILMLLMEVLSWQFDGKSGQFNWYANYISNMLFAWLTPLITCLWASYIDYHMYHSYARLKRLIFFIHPMIINTLFIIINFFTPFIFSVSADNVYAREPFMWLIVIMNTSVVIYRWVDALRHKDKINREIVIAMLAFILLPAFAAALQVLIYGAFIIWPIMAITIVVSYIYLETISTSKDYLTSLMSRHRVDEHVDYLINNKKTFGLAIIDLDDFKKINDTYGHTYGDKALKIFAKALKQNFTDKPIIGRYGGDEFIVITKPYNNAEIIKCCDDLSQSLKSLSVETDLPFEILYSFGYHIWQPKDNHTYEALFQLADKKMYENKSKSK